MHQPCQFGGARVFACGINELGARTGSGPELLAAGEVHARHAPPPTARGNLQ
jgi:hypothetical protein